MPASSFSSMNSWGLYLVAAVALVLILTPQLTALTRSSREAADWRYMDGVRYAVDSLQPGIAVNLTSFTPFALDPISFHGNEMICDYGRGTVTLTSRWPLPDLVLSPSSHYVLSLAGGKVAVAQAG